MKSLTIALFLTALLLSSALLPDLEAGFGPDSPDEVQLERERSRDPVYIAKRQLLHLAAAPGIFLAAFFGFWFLEEKVRWWPAPRGWWAMVIPALVSLIFCEIREPWDVSRGSWVWKSYIDRITWAAGLGFFGVFALYKLTPRLARVREQIKEQKRRKGIG